LKLEKILRLTPEYRDYVWGGNRLRSNGERTAEAWIVYENNLIQNGIHAGRTLGQLAAEFGEALLGNKSNDKPHQQFPILIKLLDCAQWLSLQIHPNDEQARLLEGPQHIGKTEAWHIIEASQNAQLIAGFRPEVKKNEVIKAIRNKSILDFVQYHSVHAGDSVFMPAGTIHALGPGLLLYEVQQSSDITYRVYDWNRPETPERPLHIEKSQAVVNLTTDSKVIPLKIGMNQSSQTLVSCQYFTLEYLRCNVGKTIMDTQQDSFHALTVLAGQATVIADDEVAHLDCFETALISSYTGKYSIQTNEGCTLLKTSI